MVWCKSDYSLTDCATFVSACPADWQAGHRYSFAMVDKTNGALLGSVGLSEVHSAHKFARVGYWVRTKRTGQGVASTALKLAARFAFERLALRRLEIVVPLANIPSRRVAENAGAAFEGILRARILLGEELHDAALYGIVGKDLVWNGNLPS
jgi:RimJ/RimL family protein N-acetyltransferase